jgi:UDP:flavonoid glycosyltransferase YjiC (YdhE family)
VEQLHGGVYLEQDSLTVEILQANLDKVLSDPALGDGLERIKKSFLDSGGVQRAADAIETFKQGYDLN